MPAWLITLLLALGKPAFIAFLKILENRFPGIRNLIEAIIQFLQNNPKANASEIQKHCEGLFCPTDLK